MKISLFKKVLLLSSIVTLCLSLSACVITTGPVPDDLNTQNTNPFNPPNPSNNPGPNNNPPAPPSDSTINNGVLAALANNPQTAGKGILAQTNNGLVRLTGTVNSVAIATAAIQITYGITGVTGVDSQYLIIKTTSQAERDRYTTARVTAALTNYKNLHDPKLPVGKLNIMTKEGVVIISGMVDTNEEKRQIIDVANQVRGVKQVVAQISVRQTPAGTLTPAVAPSVAAVAPAPNIATVPHPAAVPQKTPAPVSAPRVQVSAPKLQASAPKIAPTPAAKPKSNNANIKSSNEANKPVN